MQTDRFQGHVSKKFNWNEALNTVGDTLSNVFGQPDTYNTYNTTVEEEDNTMLYVGIGGVVLLVVVLLIVFMKR
jgi:hypothetical protein